MQLPNIFLIKNKPKFCLEKVQNEEIVDECCKQTQETLFSSLKPDEMKQVLKNVSDGVLNEVKVRISFQYLLK